MAGQSSNLLNRPISIGSVVLRNRLYRAPVLEGAGSEEGAAEIYRKAFEENAKAGVALIIQGNSCVTEEGRSSPGMTLVNSRERALSLSEVPSAVHLHGARIFMQIGHSGIYSMEGWHSRYASSRLAPLIAVSKPPAYVRPALIGVPWRVLSTAEVYELAESFGKTAGWIREAGYDGVQLASAN
ncbi:MAG: NADH:flavin oxidoreductase, partial [Acidimicrobiia bacterium]